MVVNVEIVLLFFIAYYFLILFYDIASIIANRHEQKVQLERQNKIKELIKNKDYESLVNVLNKINYLNSLNILLENEEKIDNKLISDILSDKNVNYIFNELLYSYKRKDRIARNCFSYTLRYIKTNSDVIYEFLEECLTDNSIYSTENALIALYNNGNVERISSAFRIISLEDIGYNSKLISDGLDNFSGDNNKLCKTLFDNFDVYNEEVKIGIVNFLRNNKYDIKESIYELLLKENSKELEIAFIRYYLKVPYDKAYKLFIERLNNNYYNDFEYDVVMIGTLVNYNNIETEKALTIKLSDFNYYIRLNAAKTLKSLNRIAKVKTKDAFALDIINYVNR